MERLRQVLRCIREKRIALAVLAAAVVAACVAVYATAGFAAQSGKRWGTEETGEEKTTEEVSEEPGEDIVVTSDEVEAYSHADEGADGFYYIGSTDSGQHAFFAKSSIARFDKGMVEAVLARHGSSEPVDRHVFTGRYGSVVMTSGPAEAAWGDYRLNGVAPRESSVGEIEARGLFEGLNLIQVGDSAFLATGAPFGGVAMFGWNGDGNPEYGGVMIGVQCIAGQVNAALWESAVPVYLGEPQEFGGWGGYKCVVDEGSDGSMVSIYTGFKLPGEYVDRRNMSDEARARLDSDCARLLQLFNYGWDIVVDTPDGNIKVSELQKF